MTAMPALVLRLTFPAFLSTTLSTAPPMSRTFPKNRGQQFTPPTGRGQIHRPHSWKQGCRDFQSPKGLQTTVPTIQTAHPHSTACARLRPWLIAKRPCGTENCRRKELRLAKRTSHTHSEWFSRLVAGAAQGTGFPTYVGTVRRCLSPPLAGGTVTGLRGNQQRGQGTLEGTLRAARREACRSGASPLWEPVPFGGQSPLGASPLPPPLSGQNIVSARESIGMRITHRVPCPYCGHELAIKDYRAFFETI
jgi:hypothetical protein